MVLADATLTIGVVGLVTTLLASLAGIGSTLWIERRRDDKEAKAARRKARVAARAVAAELVARKAEYRALRDWGATMPHGVYDELLAWRTHKDVLSAELQYRQFRTVNLAFARIELYGRGLPTGTVPETMLAGVPALLATLNEALYALQGLVADDHVQDTAS